LAARIFLFSGIAELWAIAGLLFCLAIASLLLLRQVHTVFRGEIYAETYTIRRELKVHLGWNLPAVDEITSAIVEKEIRYIRQNSRLLLLLVYPPIIFLLLAFNGSARKLPFAAKLAGLLAGLGMLAIPGVGPVVAAGWLVATAVGAIAGAGAGGVTGGVIGSLTSSGVSRERAHVYAEGIRRGGTLVTARVEEHQAVAVEQIMSRNRSVDPDSRGRTYRDAGWKAFDDTANPYTVSELERERQRTRDLTPVI
jgi:hypothetical protein